jgi:glycosyltransferase involved in cell wall biosynthesis
MTSPSVGFMITSLDVGGAQKQMLKVAGGLRGRGWDVKGVLSLTPLQCPSQHALAPEIDVTSLELTRISQVGTALGGAAAWLREREPDLIVTFLVHATLVGSVAAALGGRVPVVSSVRTENEEGRLREWLLRGTKRLRAATIFNSRSVADRCLARKLALRAGAAVIPNGVTVPEPPVPSRRLLLRQALGVSEKEFLWLAVGSLVSAKGYPTLIEACKHMDRNQTRILVAGDGPMARTLLCRAEEAGVSGFIEFLGLRDDVADLLAAADAMVSSSWWEGMPNAVMEGMAMGLPVVATEVGGIPELVESGVTGLTVPARDPASLSQAMASVMQMDEEVRSALGRRARATLEKRHSWGFVLDEWDSTLRGVLARSRPGTMGFPGPGGRPHLGSPRTGAEGRRKEVPSP